MYHFTEIHTELQVTLTKGYSLSFKVKMCSIYDLDDGLLVNVPMMHKSFPLRLNETCEDVNCAANDDVHFHFVALRNVFKGFARDLPEIVVEDDVCGALKLGETHRSSFLAKST